MPLRRAGARHVEVVDADVERIPVRRVLGRPGDDVAGELHGRLDRQELRPARDVLLQRVVLQIEHKAPGGQPLLLGQRREQRGGDRPEAVHDDADAAEARQRQSLERHLEVAQRGDRGAGAADLARRHDVVRVEADLRRQVGCDLEDVDAPAGELAEADVRLLGRAEARVHLDQRRRRADAVGVDAARVRELARLARIDA